MTNVSGDFGEVSEGMMLRQERERREEREGGREREEDYCKALSFNCTHNRSILRTKNLRFFFLLKFERQKRNRKGKRD